MAIVRTHFMAESLKKQTSVTLYLPDEKQKTYPVIYLLHGHSDDSSRWLDQTRLAFYAEKYSFAIIMPQVDLSFYADMVYGENYWQYVIKELPEKMQQWYQITQDPKQTFVAGLSMGGYGAFKCGLNYPERYRAVASFSGALDIKSLWQRKSPTEKSLKLAFGSLEKFSESNNDLLYLLQTKQYPTLDLLQMCGTEDPLYGDNQTFSQLAQDLENYSFIEQTGGHTWDFWDACLQHTLAHFNNLLAIKD